MIDVHAELDRRANVRFQEMTDRWMDEAAEAAVAGSPQRAFYIEHLVNRAGAILTEQLQAAHAERARKQAEQNRAVVS